jgi:6-phosphogluconolactonase
MPIEHFFADRTALDVALAGRCLEIMQQGLLAHGDISILLSGGTSPLPLYRRLAAAPLPWTHIHPALVDERWVSPGHPASNESAIKTAFSSNPAALANFCGMYTADAPATEAAPGCSSRYSRLPAPAFCLLGMGSDGHTASLFPQATGLAAAFASSRWCAAIAAHPSPVTGANTVRMTLTPWAILQAAHVLLLITGEEKRNVYARALAETSHEDCPVSYFLHQQRRPVEVFWCP